MTFNDERLMGDALQQSLSRRVLLRRSIALGLAVPSVAALIAACGDDSDDADNGTDADVSDEGSDDTSDDIGAEDDDEQSDDADDESDAAEQPSGEATDEELTLNYGTLQEPATLDPHLSTSVADMMLMNIYDKLTEVDTETGEVIPQLATSWEVSDDGTTVTLHLREGVLFSDGTSFDAAAAIVNFERCIALNSYIPEAFDAIDSMDEVDELTLEVTLKHVLSPWVAMICRNPKMISPTAIEEHDDGDYAQAWLAENTVGTGAYTHVRWDRGSNLVWEANPDYWGGWEGRHVTTVNNHIITEAGTQRLLIEAGELDIAMHYTLDSIPALRENPDLNVLQVDVPNNLYIRLNCFTGPTSDLRVRQAISHAFNYEEYTALLGIDPPPPRASMPVPVEVFGEGYSAVDIPYFTYDPELAMSLLAEAGYEDGFEMNHFHVPGVPKSDVVGEYFQASMAQIGIQVSIMVEDFVNILARGADQEAQQNWDTAMHSYQVFTSPAYPDPSSILLRMFTSYPESVRNLLGYENAEVERLTNEGLEETDLERAMELYWEANLLVVEDCPDLLLDRSTEFEILRSWVKGHVPHAIDPWRPTYWNIWKEM